MANDEENFADHPKSLAEARANKNSDASAWSPRDALIAALRAIDSGELNPTYAIISFANVSEDAREATTMNYFNCIPNTFYGVGMLTASITDFMNS